MVVGRESWGGLYAIFVPRNEGEVRQVVLKAESAGDAHRELEAMEREELLSLLDRSEPKELE